uniref:enhancer of mRNA-decapping protein 4-like n=1 Tax=Fragaria vesca subsp. vesca TaxID=101020 RepID=UPI0005C8AF2A|nr:PREDICTED: enhancer of mRNA-decapping protein 4-like [Fragaria vesca subsp. vesca]XP_011461584.1 PREDICTED: enhancer of mRNA-decapping protein 4-like [Fragaria vesca subsp. vesca]
MDLNSANFDHYSEMKDKSVECDSCKKTNFHSPTNHNRLTCELPLLKLRLQQIHLQHILLQERLCRKPLNCIASEKVDPFHVVKLRGQVHASDALVVEEAEHKNKKKIAQDEVSSVLDRPIMFKHPMRPISPSEFLMAPSSSENTNTVDSNTASSLYELMEQLEAGGSSSPPSGEAAVPQTMSLQDMIIQLMDMQRELPQKMSMMEKAVEAYNDALWARLQEEISKQVTGLINNFLNKDFLVVLEKMVKKELAAVGPYVVREITPALEKTISLAISDCFQRGVVDKAVNQLEKSVNSKLEATVSRQIQAQFQTSGKQALQDAIKSSMEASVVPAFEKSCKAMLEQVDATVERHFQFAHSPLANALREAISSSSSVTQTLSRELADGQRNLLNLVALIAKAQLSRLVSERRYDEAFTSALEMSDVGIVSWLCAQVDLHGILLQEHVPLSIEVLISLLKHLASDNNKNEPRKLAWKRDVIDALKRIEAMAMHIRPYLAQVSQMRQRSLQ